MTFSIVGVDKIRGEIGIAICSAIPCIGEYFAFGEAKNGIVAAQGSINPYNGLKILDILRNGIHPQEIIEVLKNTDKYIEKRQISILSFNGDKACFTGAELTLGEKFHIIGENHIAAGNTLHDISTIEVMNKTFLSSPKLPLYERLLCALENGNKTVGDIRGRQSAALHVYAEEEYPIIKINVDDDIMPVEKLREITNKFMISFYELMPFFIKKTGEEAIPAPGSKADQIFKEYKKHVLDRKF